MTIPADRLRLQLRQRAELDFARRVAPNHRLAPHLRKEWEQVAETGAADPRAFAQMFEWRFDERPWGLVIATGDVVAADVGADPDRSVSLDTPGVVPKEVFEQGVTSGKIAQLEPFTREMQRAAVFIPFAEEVSGVVDSELGRQLNDDLRERSAEKRFRARLDDQLRHEFDRFRVTVGAGFIAGQAASKNVAAKIASAPAENADRILDVLLQLRDQDLLAALGPLAEWASNNAAGMQILRGGIINLAKAAPSEVLGSIRVPARYLTT